VMVRPEQIRFVATPNAEAPCARVVAVTYYGHDASVRLVLASEAEMIASRVPGHRAPKPGDEVRLSVEGAVMAYPRAAFGAVERITDPRGARFSTSPMSVAALGIEENLP